MRGPRLATLLAVAAVLVSSSGLRAQTIRYEFADAAGTTSSSFTVTQGGTVDVRVYLTQVSGASLSNDGGLGGAYVRVNYGAGSAATVVNQTLGVGIIAGPDWNFNTTNGSNASSAVLNANTLAASGVMPTAGRIFLGTFHFTGSSTLSGDVTITAVDPNPGTLGDIGTYNSSFNLDTIGNLGTATATISVVPVPEPASILLIGTSGLAAAGWVRRRSRRRGDNREE